MGGCLWIQKDNREIENRSKTYPQEVRYQKIRGWVREFVELYYGDKN